MLKPDTTFQVVSTLVARLRAKRTSSTCNLSQMLFAVWSVPAREVPGVLPVRFGPKAGCSWR